jgi:2'-5' RNA ligase
MAKMLCKYFIAVVPEGEVQFEATMLKMGLRDTFGIRYGLRSPAHVTLKMPFLHNEKKESELKINLKRFFETKIPFELHFKGVDTFGKRVIFIRVTKNHRLSKIQGELIMHCKLTLKHELELSDRSYTPHMTLAFNDIKETQFKSCLDYARDISMDKKYLVKDVALLKKDGGKWAVLERFPLGTP